MDPDVIDWMTSNFVPFEARMRQVLARVCGSKAEIDDVIQECYYKVLTLDSVDHIREPRAFLVQMAKNIVIDRFRRESIVSIEAVANLEELGVEDASPTPERIMAARSELTWVIGLIANLPDRCKQVFRARRIYGLSQRETAATLGITEGIVEQETIKGLNLISEMVASVGPDSGPGHVTTHKRSGRKKHVNH